MAEFALVVPILLMMFIAIADFGRIFGASIAVEAATRNAAEAASNQYLADPPGPLTAAPTAGSGYYDALHAYAAGVVCAELRGLPNTNYDSGTNTCPGMPLVMVCVHDGHDSSCGSLASPGPGGAPAECGVFSPTPSNAQLAGQPGGRWVEVRTCYHFTAILSVPLFSLGDFWVERSRSFTIPCYFVMGAPTECG